MIFVKKTDGQVLTAANLNDNQSFVLSSLLAHALDGATITNQDNIKLDLFASDTATEQSNMIYNATNDNYECFDSAPSGNDPFWVIVSATSADTTGWSGASIKLMSTGKWMVYATAGTYEVNRAQVIGALFNSASGYAVTKFTTITAIQTNDSRDIGKKAQYAARGSAAGTSDGTFAATSGNEDVSSWSNLYAVTNGAQWSIPVGEVRNDINNTTNNEIGTDTSADETDNPADCEIVVGNGTYSGSASVIILSAETISWAGAVALTTDIDFLVDYSIPVFTTAGDLLSCYIITSGTTITTAEDVAIINSLSTADATSTVSYEVSFDDGSTWVAITNKALTEVSSAGTSMKFKMTITRTDATKIDTLNGYAAYYSS